MSIQDFQQWSDLFIFVFMGRYHIWVGGEQYGRWDHTVTMIFGGPLSLLL